MFIRSLALIPRDKQTHGHMQERSSSSLVTLVSQPFAVKKTTFTADGKRQIPVYVSSKETISIRKRCKNNSQ